MRKSELLAAASRGDPFEFIACRKSKLSIATIDDAEFIVSLRDDPALNKYLSVVDPDVEQQIAWLHEYKKRERQCQEFYFIIKSINDERLGTVRLYDFRPDSFCWGSWIVKLGAPRKTAIESAISVYEFAFHELGFSASHFDVRNENIGVINFHQRMGAKVISSDSLDTFFKFERSHYEQSRENYQEFLSAKAL